MEAAAAFLAARPRSVAEVRRRLRHAGYRPELVEPVLGRLGELGYLDDESFARAWVESRDRAHPRGERALRQELFQKGIDRETVDLVLGERAQGVAEPGKETLDRAHVAVDRPEGAAEATPEPPVRPDVSAAQRLLDRHHRQLLREPDPARRRQKAYALLARNGFDPEVCREVASSVAGPLSDGSDSL